MVIKMLSSLDTGLLNFQGDFRDVIYRVFILIIIAIVYVILDFPRRIMIRSLENCINMVEVLNECYNKIKLIEYNLVKKVLLEEIIHDKYNIIAATFHSILEENPESERAGIEQQEITQNEIRITTEEVILPSVTPRVKKRSQYRSNFTTQSKSSDISISASSQTCLKYSTQQRRLLTKYKTNIKDSSSKIAIQSEKPENNKRNESGSATEEYEGINKKSMTLPTTIVATCEVDNVYVGMIQNIDSKTFPFFDQKSQKSNKLFPNLNENHDEITYQMPIYDHSFPKKCYKKTTSSEPSKNKFCGDELNKIKLNSKHNHQEEITEEVEEVKPCTEIKNSSIYKVRCHPKQSIIENITQTSEGNEISTYLQPKYWFHKREVWNQRCKHIVRTFIQVPKQEELFCQLFSKSSHELSLKFKSRFQNESKMTKSKNKIREKNQKFKNTDRTITYFRKSIKLNNNYKKNNGGKQNINKQQNIIDLQVNSINTSLVGPCDYINGETHNNSSCFTSCNTSVHSNSVDGYNDDCFCTEDLNSSWSEGSDFNINNNNSVIVNTTNDKTNLTSDSCASFISHLGCSTKEKQSTLNAEENSLIQLSSQHSPVLEAEFQSRELYQYKNLENQDCHDTESGIKLFLRHRDEDTNKGNELNVSYSGNNNVEGLKERNLLTNIVPLVDYDSCEQNNRLQLLSERDIVRIPSKSYKSGMKFEKLETVKEEDEESIVEISHCASGGYVSCVETDMLGLLEETDEESDTYLDRTSSSFKSCCENDVAYDTDEEKISNINRTALGDCDCSVKSSNIKAVEGNYLDSVRDRLNLFVMLENESTCVSENTVVHSNGNNNH